LYVHDGRVTFAVNRFGDIARSVAHKPLSAGRHELIVRCSPSPTGDTAVVMSVGDTQLGAGAIPGRLPSRWQIGGASLRLGHDSGLPVDDAYQVPAVWTGGLDSVTVIPAAGAQGSTRLSEAMHAD
jgi:arylsulfatase